MFVVGCPTLYFMSTHLAAFPWSLSIPFSLLFAAESMRDRPRARIIAVLLALICLSHLLSGMMTLLCTGLAHLVIAPPRPANIASHLGWLGVIVLVLAPRHALPLNLPLNPAQVNARRLGIVTLCALVLGTELAYPLYAYLGPMQKLQFPYRFMFLASILASIALAIQLNEAHGSAGASSPASRRYC